MFMGSGITARQSCMWITNSFGIWKKVVELLMICGGYGPTREKKIFFNQQGRCKIFNIPFTNGIYNENYRIKKCFWA